MSVRPAVAALIAAFLVAACDSEERKDVTASRAVMRPNTSVPPGAAPRGTNAQLAALSQPPATAPPPGRGRERFAIFCSPCHGLQGRGDGTVVSRGFPRPPSFHDERLRDVTAERIVSVITHGVGLMPSYAGPVTPEDRWAIASYVKALQAEGEIAGPAPSARAASP